MDWRQVIPSFQAMGPETPLKLVKLAAVHTPVATFGGYVSPSFSQLQDSQSLAGDLPSVIHRCLV
jgi:hypothetical protein